MQSTEPTTGLLYLLFDIDIVYRCIYLMWAHFVLYLLTDNTTCIVNIIRLCLGKNTLRKETVYFYMRVIYTVLYVSGMCYCYSQQ
jgi:hypothetical protein